MPPPWVPKVGATVASTWLDFRSQQYWNNNAIVADLYTLLRDVNGHNPFSFIAGKGIDISQPPPFGVLPSAQTTDNGIPPLPNPTISPVLQMLNTLATAGGYTAIVGFIYQGGNGNGATFEVGSPWQNPPTSNFNLLELGTNDGSAPNYNMTIGIEQATPAFFYSYTTPVLMVPPPPFSPPILANQQITVDELAPSITFSMNGLPAVGPIVTDEAMNAEGDMQFLYLGGVANSVDGILQTNSLPIGILQYFALFSPLALPLVNFPAAFLPGGGGSGVGTGGGNASTRKLPGGRSQQNQSFTQNVNSFSPAPFSTTPLQEQMAQQEADRWCV